MPTQKQNEAQPTYRPHAIVFKENSSKTQQQFAKDANINNIMGKYTKTGLIPQDPSKKMFFGDFTRLPDYAQAKNATLEVEQRFMSLPAEIRFKFENNPQRALDFLSDPANKIKAQELGLIKKENQPSNPPPDLNAPVAPKA